MKRFGFSKVMLWLGLLFIYVPMFILVIYSFNGGRLVTVWSGWSLKWYVGLLDNTKLMTAVFRSLEIAFYTSIAAVALGTLAAFVLTRIPRFRGRTLFGGMVTATVLAIFFVPVFYVIVMGLQERYDNWRAQRQPTPSPSRLEQKG